LIRCAKSRVAVDSVTADGSGLMVHITEMRALPESEGSSFRVSLELRKGTWSLWGRGRGSLAWIWETDEWWDVRFVLSCVLG
jgi:hypothetical protein